MDSNLLPERSQEKNYTPAQISPVDAFATAAEDNIIHSTIDSSSGTTSSPLRSPSTSSSSSKGVSFAPLLVVPNNHSRVKDPEFVNSNISALREELSQVHIDLSAEKAIRKKKDKSLFKLAKQLAVQTEENTQMEKYIREVSELLRHIARS